MNSPLSKQAKSNIRQIFYCFCWIAFIIYLVFLFYVLLFKADPRFSPLDYTQAYQASFRKPSNYNLIPFKTIKSYWLTYAGTGSWSAILNLLGNVLAFIPYGILFPVLTKRQKTFLLTLLSGACLIFLIEGIQLITVWGILDVDDFFLNISGLILGWFIYWLMSRLLTKQ